jgi:uncharacterized protein involved in outer membrane biogenesis
MTAHVPPAGRRARFRRWQIVLGVLLVALIVLWWVFDWNWFKHPIERRVEAATGRTFKIEGDLSVHLGVVPRLRAEGLRLSNADWATEKDMAHLHSLEISIRLLPLFKGRIELPVLRLEKPHLLLEQNEAGDANWTFAKQDKADSSPGRPWHIDQFIVTDGELRVHETKYKTDLRLDFRTETADAGGHPAPLVAKGEGRYRDGDFELEGRVDSPLELRDVENPYHIDVKARAGATHAHVSGDLIAPLQMEDINVAFMLSGSNLADLHKLIGLPLPATPPYKLSGELGHKGTVWSYRKFSGTVGGSDLGGDISVDTGRDRLFLRGVLVSRELDLDDLAGFIGAGPSAEKAESPQQKREAVQRAESPRVLPYHPYDLTKLRSIDVDVSLNAHKISADPLPIDAMNVHMFLDNGMLRLDPLELKVAEGTVTGNVRLDARQDPIDSALDLHARNLDLPRLMPSMKAQNIGRVGGYLKLSGKGNSVANMLGSANGETGLVMGRGRLSNLLLELAGLDIAESLEFLLAKDRTVPVRCAYADVEAKEGVFTPRALALDTTDTVVFGEGSVNLREETLAMKLKVKPKDMSPVTVRTPLRITGTLKHPKVRPEMGPLALRAVAAAALFAVAPPAALLALIETGPGKDTDCGASDPNITAINKNAVAKDQKGPAAVEKADAKAQKPATAARKQDQKVPAAAQKAEMREQAAPVVNGKADTKDQKIPIATPKAEAQEQKAPVVDRKAEVKDQKIPPVTDPKSR